ncbi:MAG TPA: 4Fe-4S dicluster domain-containing protein [Thermoanaerobaculia bacterium]
MTRNGFLVDLNYCISCKACEVACKTWNAVPTDRGIRWRRVVDELLGVVPRTTAYSVSLACNHCENPACVRACPNGALTMRADGLVVHDKTKCVGCRYCESVCPYGAPQYDAVEKVMTKCTGCFDRVDQGLLPACVDACPAEALKFGPLAEIDREGIREIPRFPNPNRTRPAVRFVPKES